MECESCLPRVTLLDGVKMLVKRSDKSEIVAFDLNLPADTYTIWAATQPGRGGRYRLTISNTEVTPKHLVFTGITAKQQVGTKTKSVSTRVRLGWDSITLTDVYYKVVKSFEFKDIQEVGSNVASKTDIGTAILLGPAWAHSSDKWISIRTADETLVLSVPGNTFQILLTELQRRTQKK
jgi:hypothetical protein